MKTRKRIKVARAAAEGFSTAAAVTSLVIDVVGGFVRNGIPGFVKWVVTGLVGLIAGCFSGRNAIRAEEERERLREARRNQHIQLVADVKQELHDIKEQFDHKNVTPAVQGRINLAYANLDDMHRRISANDRFFKSKIEDTRLLDSKYSSSSDESDEDVPEIQLAKLGK